MNIKAIWKNSVSWKKGAAIGLLLGLAWAIIVTSFMASCAFVPWTDEFYPHAHCFFLVWERYPLIAFPSFIGDALMALIGGTTYLGNYDLWYVSVAVTILILTVFGAVVGKGEVKIPKYFHLANDTTLSKILKFFFLITPLVFDLLIAFLISIILNVWTPFVAHQDFFLARLLSSGQNFLESILFYTPGNPSFSSLTFLAPLSFFFLPGALITYVVIRTKRNIEKLFFQKNTRYIFFIVPILSLLLLLIFPFIILPNIF